MEIEIREAKSQDQTSVLTWLSDPELLPFLQTEKGREVKDLAQFWVSPQKPSLSFIATIKKKPVGILVIFASDYNKITHWAFCTLLVAKNKRGCGVAKALLQAADLWAKKRGCERLIMELYESPFTQAFEKLGFKPYATQEGYVKVEGGYLSRTLFARSALC